MSDMGQLYSDTEKSEFDLKISITVAIFHSYKYVVIVDFCSKRKLIEMVT